MFAQRFLGSPRGKHCNWLEGNVWRKFVRTLKKTILGRGYRFSPLFFIRNRFGWCWHKGSVSFCLNNHELCSKIYRLNFLHAQGLLRNSEMLATYHQELTQQSLLSFFLTSVKSTSSFFLGLVIQKSAKTATSRQLEIEMVCFSIKYYRGTLKWLNTYITSFLWSVKMNQRNRLKNETFILWRLLGINRSLRNDAQLNWCSQFRPEFPLSCYCW